MADDDWAETYEAEMSKHKKRTREAELVELEEKTNKILKLIEDSHSIPVGSNPIEGMDKFSKVIFFIVSGSWESAENEILLYMDNKDIYRLYIFTASPTLPQFNLFFKARNIWNKLSEREFSDTFTTYRNATLNILKLEKYYPKWMYWALRVAIPNRNAPHITYTLTKDGIRIKVTVKMKPFPFIKVTETLTGAVSNKTLPILSLTTIPHNRGKPFKRTWEIYPEFTNVFGAAAATVYSYLRQRYTLNIIERTPTSYSTFPVIESCISCNTKKIDGKCSQCKSTFCGTCFKEHVIKDH